MGTVWAEGVTAAGFVRVPDTLSCWLLCRSLKKDWQREDVVQATFCSTKNGRPEAEKPETVNWHRCFSQVAADPWWLPYFVRVDRAEACVHRVRLVTVGSQTALFP